MNSVKKTKGAVMRPRIPHCAVLAAVLLLPALSNAPAQPHEPSDAAIDRAVERLLQSGDIDREEEDRDELWLVREQPIELATTSPDELASLPGISFQDAINILRVIRERRPTSFLALDSSGLIARDHMVMLRAFTTLGTPMEDAVVSARLRFGSRLQLPRGARDTLRRIVSWLDAATGSVLRDTLDAGRPYMGGPHAVLLRCDVTHPRFEAGLTVESDSHEPILFRDTSALSYARWEEVDADSLEEAASVLRFNAFVSGYLLYRSGSVRFLLGDFTAGFGQGLAYGGPVSGRGTPQTFDRPLHPSPGVRPYRSVGESGFLRGAAAEATVLQSRMLTGTITAFASWMGLDAAVTRDVDSAGRSIVAVGAVDESGYRRTVSAIRGAGSVVDRSIGIAAGIAGIGWSAGAVWASEGRSTLGTASEQVGRCASVHFRRGTSTSSTFAELATDGARLALVAGVTRHLTGSDVRITIASMPLGFLSNTASAHPVGDLSPGEHVLDLGMRTRSGPLTGDLLLELRSHSGRTISRPFPGWTATGVLDVEVAASNSLTLRCRLRAREGLDALRNDDVVGRFWREGATARAIGLRFGLELAPPELPLDLRAHFERRLVEYDGRLPPAAGWATYLAVRFEIASAVTFAGVAALHSSSAADAAPTVAFSDLPGHTVNLRLYGEGSVIGLSARWRIANGIGLSASFSQTRRIDHATLRSGLDELAGPVEHALWLQLDVRPTKNREPG